MDINEIAKKELGLYDSSTNESISVLAYKIVDLTDICSDTKRCVIKYADVVKGRIAQICDWYKSDEDMGMTLHYHINYMTPETLANDPVFNLRARMMGAKPIILSQEIFNHQ